MFKCLTAIDLGYEYTKRPLNEKSRPLVVHSGGADSTLIVFDLLSRGIAMDLMYVNGSAWTPKQEAERAAVNAQFKLFERSYPKVWERCKTRPVETKFFLYSDNITRSTQPINWIAAAMGALNKDNTHVIIGNIAGDQGSAYLSDMQAAWDSIVKFTLTGEAQSIHLEFPLKLMSKVDVLVMYQQSDSDFRETTKELYLTTWTCQLPSEVDGKFKTCLEEYHPMRPNGCESCIARASAEYAYRLTYDKSNLFNPIWTSDLFNKTVGYKGKDHG